MQATREVDALAADAVDALDEAVAGLVHAVKRAARNPAHGALPALELAGLLAQGERRLGELATQRGVCQSVVSRQVGELEARGLVVRRPDPADRRAGLVSLTPTGRTLLDTRVLVLGNETAVVTTRFGYSARPDFGRQTQIWFRFGTKWRIVEAHVSESGVA